MRSSFNSTSVVPEEIKQEYNQAISDWVSSLSRREAETPSIFVSGMGYSPVDIRDAVTNETDFGNNFIAGLFALSRRSNSSDSHRSIVDLVRQSTCR